MKTAAKYFCLLLSSCFLIMTTCKKEDEDPNKPVYGILELETYDATDIQGSSAVLHGELVTMSSPGVKEFGFIIDTAGIDGRAEYRRVSMGNYLKKPSVFQTIVSSLPKGPTYYFKAFAVDDDNIEAIGSEKSFTLAEFSITFFFPSSGSMKDLIYLYGNNFGGVTANSVVTFDGVPATIVSAGQDTIAVEAPKPSTATHKLSTIQVTINGKMKEYSNKFEYNPLYTMPYALWDYDLESAFLINGENIGYIYDSFSEFDEESFNWKTPWYLTKNTFYCLSLNNYLYTLVSFGYNIENLYRYDPNLISYTTLNYFSDTVYITTINNVPDRSVNQLFSINNYLYQAFIDYYRLLSSYPKVCTHQLWKYSISYNAWSQMNNMPDTGMIFTLNDNAYLLNNKHMYKYNATTDDWNDLNISALPQINDSTYRTQFHYAYNGLDYFFNWNSEEIWSFDPTANIWTFVDNTPVPIIDPLMFQRDNMFFVQEKKGDHANEAWLYFIFDE